MFLYLEEYDTPGSGATAMTQDSRTEGTEGHRYLAARVLLHRIVLLHRVGPANGLHTWRT